VRWSTILDALMATCCGGSSFYSIAPSWATTRSQEDDSSNGGKSVATREGDAFEEAEAATATAPSAEVEKRRRLEFLEKYQDAIKTFDPEGAEPAVFFRGVIEKPEEWTAICPRGVELVRVDGDLWEALVRKVPNEGHERVVTEFGKQLGVYADAINTRYTPMLAAGGGHRKIGEIRETNGDILPEKRADPDQALRVVLKDDQEPRVVVEVELSNRSPLKLAEWVDRLMRSWTKLRVVVGLKIYTRTPEDLENDTFACVCFVWKKLDGDAEKYSVERVFDIGTRASGMSSKKEVADFWTKNGVNYDEIKEDASSFKVEPVPAGLKKIQGDLGPGKLPLACPDDLADHFTVTIDMGTVYYGCDREELREEPASKKAKLKVEMAKAALGDDETLELDLYEVTVALNSIKTEKFD